MHDPDPDPVPQTNESGSGSSKNMWIRWIRKTVFFIYLSRIRIQIKVMRIRNTAPEVFRTHQQSFIRRVKDPGVQCSIAISAFGSVLVTNGSGCGSVSRNNIPNPGPQDPTFYLKPIPDPGSRGQKGTGSGIPDPDQQHWVKILKLFDADPGWIQYGFGIRDG